MIVGNMTVKERNSLLEADDMTLFHQCHAIMQKGTGNGGQKINKTSSAVRLRHSVTGISVVANEYRSQFENRHAALNKLRLAIALKVRCIPTKENVFSLDSLPSFSNSSRFLPWCAILLDYAEFFDWNLEMCSEHFSFPVKKFKKILLHYPSIWRIWSENLQKMKNVSIPKEKQEQN